LRDPRQGAGCYVLCNAPNSFQPCSVPSRFTMPKKQLEEKQGCPEKTGCCSRFLEKPGTRLLLAQKRNLCFSQFIFWSLRRKNRKALVDRKVTECTDVLLLRLDFKKVRPRRNTIFIITMVALQRAKRVMVLETELAESISSRPPLKTQNAPCFRVARGN